MTIYEVAEFLNVSVDYVRILISAGTLKVIPNTVLFNPLQIVQYKYERDVHRKQLLRELTWDAEEIGAYDFEPMQNPGGIL